MARFFDVSLRLRVDDEGLTEGDIREYLAIQMEGFIASVHITSVKTGGRASAPCPACHQPIYDVEAKNHVCSHR